MNNILKCLLLLLFLLISVVSYNQTCDIYNTALTSNKTITSSICIILGAGFSTGSYTLSVQVVDAGELDYSPPLPGNYNYIIETLPQQEMVSIDPASLKVKDIIENITYYDGLGRPMQSVAHRASPVGNDIVSPVYYDGYGRESKNYLPYSVKTLTEGTIINNGHYRPLWESEQQDFYHYDMGFQPITITSMPMEKRYLITAR